MKNHKRTASPAVVMRGSLPRFPLKFTALGLHIGRGARQSPSTPRGDARKNAGIHAPADNRRGQFSQWLGSFVGIEPERSGIQINAKLVLSARQKERDIHRAGWWKHDRPAELSRRKTHGHAIVLINIGDSHLFLKQVTVTNYRNR